MCTDSKSISMFSLCSLYIFFVLPFKLFSLSVKETFDGEHVECVADAFFLHKMENRDDLILSDGDIRSTVIDLVGAGRL